LTKIGNGFAPHENMQPVEKPHLAEHCLECPIDAKPACKVGGFGVPQGKWSALPGVQISRRLTGDPEKIQPFRCLLLHD
jgi:hypothetical protein